MAAPDDDEREREIEALRAQVETMREEAATTQKQQRTRRRWGRGTGAVVLFVIAGILLPSAVTAVWANRLVSNTDRYVQTVAPLAHDPAMQAAITNRITTELDQYVDVQSLTSEALSAIGGIGPLKGTLATQLQALAGPITEGVNNFVQSEVAKIVASPQFATAWDAANRIAHTQFVAVMTGKGNGTVSVSNGQVSVNLAPFIETVKNQLVASGFTLASKIPTVNVSIVLFQSKDLTKAQTAFRALGTTAWLLPLLVLLLLIGGVLLAPSRRLGFIGAGLAVAIAMAVSLAALSVGRIIYLHEIPSDVLPGGAAGSAFDIVTRFLKQGLRALFFFGIVTVVAAVLAGPSRGAAAVRHGWVGGLQHANRWLRSIGVPTQPAAAWVEANALLLRIILLAAGVVTLLLWSYPTPKVAVWITIAVLFGLAVVDFLRAPVTEPVASGAGGSGEHPITA